MLHSTKDAWRGLAPIKPLLCGCGAPKRLRGAVQIIAGVFCPFQENCDIFCLLKHCDVFHLF